MMRRAALFPGQGAQAVGMGRSLRDAYPAARRVFAEVDEALGIKLSALIFDGPADQLVLTENAQPALMATSLAAVRALEAETGRSLTTMVDLVAGHSLGEYSALAAAGTLSIADAARLLHLRGRAMQAAVPVGQGAMAAILGLDVAIVETIAAEAAGDGGVCELANDNSDGQAVVSGTKATVERAIEIAKGKGGRRSLMLQVSAPFHCALMAPAAEALAPALAAASLKAPGVPLMANVTAALESDPDRIRDLLVRQVTARVRWRESMQAMAALGIDVVVELGAGKVLSGLAKRGVAGATLLNIQDAGDVTAVAAALAG